MIITQWYRATMNKVFVLDNRERIDAFFELIKSSDVGSVQLRGGLVIGSVDEDVYLSRPDLFDALTPSFDCDEDANRFLIEPVFPPQFPVYVERAWEVMGGDVWFLRRELFAMDRVALRLGSVGRSECESASKEFAKHLWAHRRITGC